MMSLDIGVVIMSLDIGVVMMSFDGWVRGAMVCLNSYQTVLPDGWVRGAMVCLNSYQTVLPECTRPVPAQKFTFPPPQTTASISMYR